MSEPLRSLQRSFTRTRLLEALRLAAIAAVIAGPAVWLSDMPGHAWPYAVVLVALAAAMGYLGRLWGKMTGAALLLGTMPLSCALLAQMIGHVCTPGGCASLCVPLCTSGGLAAGLLLARIAVYSPRPPQAWLTGAVVISCAGAIGCSCVGASGVLGMIAGLGVGSGLLRLIHRNAGPPAAR